MSFAEYKEKISEGDTVILFLVSGIIFSNNSVFTTCVSEFVNTDCRVQHVHHLLHCKCTLVFDYWHHILLVFLTVSFRGISYQFSSPLKMVIAVMFLN